MSYKCLVVDDEELARNLIANHIEQLNDFELVGKCSSAIEASKLLAKDKVDLMFLDIEMPVLRGTDFLKNLAHPPHVIFTTAYREFALDGFDLNAVDYLLKPITFARFFKAIEKFKATQETISKAAATPFSDDFLFVRSDRKMVKVKLDQITYVESVKDYIHIHTESGSHITKQTLTTFASQLDDRFLRIHRSFIVNIKKVSAYTKLDVEIGSKQLPIGDTYKSAVFNIFS